MGKICRSPEQIVRMLREIEVSVVNGGSVRTACREHQITEQTYYIVGVESTAVSRPTRRSG